MLNLFRDNAYLTVFPSRRVMLSISSFAWQICTWRDKPYRCCWPSIGARLISLHYCGGCLPPSLIILLWLKSAVFTRLDIVATATSANSLIQLVLEQSSLLNLQELSQPLQKTNLRNKQILQQPPFPSRAAFVDFIGRQEGAAWNLNVNSNTSTATMAQRSLPDNAHNSTLRGMTLSHHFWPSKVWPRSMGLQQMAFLRRKCQLRCHRRMLIIVSRDSSRILFDSRAPSRCMPFWSHWAVRIVTTPYGYVFLDSSCDKIVLFILN